MSPLAVHTKSSDSVDSVGSDATSPDNAVKNDKKKKSIIPKIFSSKRSGRGGSEEDAIKSDGENVVHELDKKITAKKQTCMETPYPIIGKCISERSHTSAQIESLNLSNFEQCIVPTTEVQDFRIFVTTWNVGGKAPHSGLNLQDFLQVEDASDIYILGFQEIVPLNAGNVLVVEDNEPAAKWLGLISQALNKPPHEFDSDDGSSHSNNSHLKESKSHNFFQKPSLKVLSRNFRADSSLLKTCNCPFETPIEETKRVRKLSAPLCKLDSILESNQGSNIDNLPSTARKRAPRGKISYRLIASKQMVGIFLSVWARHDLVPHIGHLRLTSLGRGIMGRLGNKGCIAISMSLHQTSFCFICSHLASGEKEGDELKRNSDVANIFKSASFPKTCKYSHNRAPEKIIDHQRIIWLGDLNYRVALTYEETRILLEDNDWDALLEKDQLNIEREAGRVFSGFKEGRIFFAPTYKYSHNSDSYAGETVKSKKKRRTPAWCDRILWHGDGMEQLSYFRGESRFSDHRPVCATFSVEVEVLRNVQRFRKGYSFTGRKLGLDDCIAKRHGFYEI